jgi:hypothetical protein
MCVTYDIRLVGSIPLKSSLKAIRTLAIYRKRCNKLPEYVSYLYRWVDNMVPNYVGLL